jgi:hypothetical protein
MLTVAGLNGLKDITVNVQNLSVTHFPDGSNMKGTITINNPSVMTLDIGDVVQDVYLQDGTLIGNSTISNIYLTPGNNNVFNLSSTTDITKVLPVILNSTTGDLPVTTKTTSVTYQGQNLTYFTAAMAATPVNVTLNLKAALANIGIDLDANALGGSSSSSSSSDSSSSTTSALSTPSASSA